MTPIRLTAEHVAAFQAWTKAIRRSRAAYNADTHRQTLHPSGTGRCLCGAPIPATKNRRYCEPCAAERTATSKRESQRRLSAQRRAA